MFIIHVCLPCAGPWYPVPIDSCPYVDNWHKGGRGRLEDRARNSRLGLSGTLWDLAQRNRKPSSTLAACSYLLPPGRWKLVGGLGSEPVCRSPMGVLSLEGTTDVRWYQGWLCLAWSWNISHNAQPQNGHYAHPIHSFFF